MKKHVTFSELTTIIIIDNYPNDDWLKALRESRSCREYILDNQRFKTRIHNLELILKLKGMNKKG